MAELKPQSTQDTGQQILPQVQLGGLPAPGVTSESQGGSSHCPSQLGLPCPRLRWKCSSSDRPSTSQRGAHRSLLQVRVSVFTLRPHS